MTNLVLPDWYEGGDEDIEDAICDYFEWLLEDVYVCTWLPTGHYTPGSSEGTQPTLRIWRQPGRFDPCLRADEALIQIAAITPTRAQSWRLIGFVRRMLDDDVFAGFAIPRKDGSKTVFRKSEEWVGPQLVPERVVDDKFVPVTYKIQKREPIGLPNYGRILKSLPH